jgi:uncharacterized protein (DUF1499 family)
MNLSKLGLGLFIIFLASCKQELKVAFPSNIEKIENIMSYKHTVIIYIDGRECTACSLNDLKPWKLYEKSFDKFNINVLLVIFSANEQNAIRILNSLNIKFPVVFDKKGEFRTINSKIFKVVSDGVFVIDKDKNVIFTGSPIADEKKWNSFIELVKH